MRLFSDDWFLCCSNKSQKWDSYLKSEMKSMKATKSLSKQFEQQACQTLSYNSRRQTLKLS